MLGVKYFFHNILLRIIINGSLESVLIEMEQLRLETDTAGPQDELEYWKKRMAKFTFLAQQMDLPHVRQN